MTTDSPYITAQELADYVRGTLDEVYDMAQKGVIPVAFRWGSRYRFDRDQVIQALANRAKDTNDD